MGSDMSEILTIYGVGSTPVTCQRYNALMADDKPKDPADKPTVYSVPRRYDLATLFVVSVAFSILFGALKLGKARPEVFLLIVGFVTVVGLSQAILTKLPRAASVLSGAGFFVFALIVIAVAEGMPRRFLNAGILCFAIQGGICGYVAGTMIGGVFLAADYCRKFARRIRSN